MSKFNRALLLMALFAIHAVHASGGHKKAPSGKSAAASSSASGSSNTGSTASGSANAVSYEGSASAVSRSSGRSFAATHSALVSYCRLVLKKNYIYGHCKDYKCCPRASYYVQRDIKAVVAALAAAYSSTSVRVSVQGRGSACADARATAYADAKEFVGVCLKALNYAKQHYGVGKHIYIDFDTVLGAFAKAFTSAYSRACARDNGSASAWQNSVAKALSAVYYNAAVKYKIWDVCRPTTYLDVTQYAAEKEITSASSSGGGSSSGNGEFYTGGNAGATAVAFCKTKAYQKCCYGKPSVECGCGFGCYGKYTPHNKSVAIWHQGRNYNCACH